jgi:hypothetical protein
MCHKSTKTSKVNLAGEYRAVQLAVRGITVCSSKPWSALLRVLFVSGRPVSSCSEQTSLSRLLAKFHLAPNAVTADPEGRRLRDSNHAVRTTYSKEQPSSAESVRRLYQL